MIKNENVGLVMPKILNTDGSINIYAKNYKPNQFNFTLFLLLQIL